MPQATPTSAPLRGVKLPPTKPGASKRAPPAPDSSASSSASRVPTPPSANIDDPGATVLYRRRQQSHLRTLHADRPSPIRIEQLILDCVRHACEPVVTSTLQNGWDDLPAALRVIKSLFTRRDYAAIFASGDDRLLVAYAAGYDGGRAMCYWELFTSITPLRGLLTLAARKRRVKGFGGSTRVLALGAGPGAELVGIAAAMVAPLAQAAADGAKEDAEAGGAPTPEVVVHVQDIADYGSVIGSLETSIRKHFGLDASRLGVTFSTGDVLNAEPGADGWVSEIAEANLVTALFLLNELLSASKKDFVKLVSLLVENMKKGAYLLVIDSAGSFSEVVVGGAKRNAGAEDEDDEDRGAQSREPPPAGRTYMVYQLLDQISAFETAFKDDSRWYRFPVEPPLEYPVKLHNMRHFVRLYKML
ncbi:hypothetical protein HK101_004575 [Irineochytrium annulatum]|nr:hypothetical protein HK101_004575 [Irineochytrium annulatum]